MVPHQQQVYFARIEAVLQDGARWLDLGCGRSLAPVWHAEREALEQRLRARAGMLVGLDVDAADLRANRSCTYCVHGTAPALPFASGGYDLVTSNMVFEHLADPSAALAEIRRVLRPGGRALLHTPSQFGLVTIVAQAIPDRWHAAIIRRIEGRVERVHPKWYAFNRRASIERALRTAGFPTGSAHIQYIQGPRMYAHLPGFAQLEAAWCWLAARIPTLRAALLIEVEAD